MPIEFQLESQLVGFATSASVEGGTSVDVCYRELVSPTDVVHFFDRVEHLQRALFNAIPGLPSPSITDHLLIIIRPDLSGVAYVNELNMTAMVKVNRPIKAGEAVRVPDIEDINSVDLGVDVPDDAAVVLIRSVGWRRSVYFDFGPLLSPPIARAYSLEATLAKQALLLMGLTADDPGEETRLAHMKAGLLRLKELLAESSDDEGEYQELLELHPWMLGGVYDVVARHAKLDDERIPDFTARRSYDNSHDIIEIKQPFLKLFRKNGSFAAPFNNAWNQVEKYLTFAERQRAYLRDEKGLLFENPQCLLLIGHGLTDKQRKAIHEKEVLVRVVSVRTYDELLSGAEHLVSLMETASELVIPNVESEEP